MSEQVGCGFPVGVDYTYCGWLGMLCCRCESAGAGAETSDGSGLRSEGFLPRSVDGFTPAPDHLDPRENDSKIPQAEGPPCPSCGAPTDALGSCTGSCDPGDTYDD